MDWRVELTTGDLKAPREMLQRQNVSYYSQYLGMNDCTMRAAGATWLFVADHDSFLVSPAGLRLPEILSRYAGSHVLHQLWHFCAGPCIETVAHAEMPGNHTLDAVPWDQCATGFVSNTKPVVNLNANPRGRPRRSMEIMVHGPPPEHPFQRASPELLLHAHLTSKAGTQCQPFLAAVRSGSELRRLFTSISAPDHPLF